MYNHETSIDDRSTPLDAASEGPNGPACPSCRRPTRSARQAVCYSCGLIFARWERNKELREARELARLDTVLEQTEAKPSSWARAWSVQGLSAATLLGAAVSLFVGVAWSAAASGGRDGARAARVDLVAPTGEVMAAASPSPSASPSLLRGVASALDRYELNFASTRDREGARRQLAMLERETAEALSAPSLAGSAFEAATRQFVEAQEVVLATWEVRSRSAQHEGVLWGETCMFESERDFLRVTGDIILEGKRVANRMRTLVFDSSRCRGSKPCEVEESVLRETRVAETVISEIEDRLDVFEQFVAAQAVPVASKA